MILGKKTKLIAFEPHHGAFIRAWMTDPDYRYYFRNIPEVLTEQQYGLFPQLMGMNVFMVLENSTDKVIGMATWDNVRMLARTCDVGFLVDKTYQGVGLSKDAWMTFINYLVNRLGFHKIIAKVAATEEATISKGMWGGLNKEAYFKEEFFLDGTWHDEVRFSVLDRDFKLRYNQYLEGESLWAEAKAENKAISGVVNLSRTCS